MTPREQCDQPAARASLTTEERDAIQRLALIFPEFGTGDIMAVSWSIRNVILARFQWIAEHGKDAGE